MEYSDTHKGSYYFSRQRSSTFALSLRRFLSLLRFSSPLSIISYPSGCTSPTPLACPRLLPERHRLASSRAGAGRGKGEHRSNFGVRSCPLLRSQKSPLEGSSYFHIRQCRKNRAQNLALRIKSFRESLWSFLSFFCELWRMREQSRDPLLSTLCSLTTFS